MFESSEPLLFEIGSPGRRAVELPALDVPGKPLASLIPEKQIRTNLPLPELSEPEVIRHYTRLSQRNFSIDSGFYPLGSCTMKYNPKINEDVARLSGFGRIHPLQPTKTVQGALEVMYTMQDILSEVGGMDATSLQPAAGAHGELLGLMLIQAYQKSIGQGHRDTILVPEAAHGTNPASAARCGFKTKSIRSDARGRVDVDHLKSLLGDHVAGFMLTNPNTAGLFEDNVAEICEIIHAAGGQVYCDGANMNALVGRARPGDMGFDVMHYNLHKTFSSPHGGGGPGSGPVSVKSHLAPFLPAPMVVKTDDGYDLQFDRPGAVGKIHGFYGSFMCILRSYVFIMYYGQQGLKTIAENSVLNANYIRVKLQDQFDVAFDGLCMHECIFTLKRQSKEYGVKAIDVAKRLMDFGIHPPTMYFPLMVPEALMVEPTETESIQTLDHFIQVMQQIADEAINNPDIVRNAPTATPVRKLDEATAARQPCLCWTPPADTLTPA